MSTTGVLAGCIEDMWQVAIEIARRAGGAPGRLGLVGPVTPPAPVTPERLIVLETEGWPDLDDASKVEVAAKKTATRDLKLRKTEDLAAQLSNGEWMASVPGTDQQKGILLNCVGCHTIERFMRSPHDADALMKVTLPRMQGYVNQSIPQHPQLRKAERLMEERGDQRVQVYRSTAEYARQPARMTKHDMSLLETARALHISIDEPPARAEILAAVDEAETSLARGEGRIITQESMRELAEDVKQRGRARLGAPH